MTRMKTVYIETSVISYLTSRPSRDLIIAAHQQITADWWENVLFQNFKPCISEAVIDEAGQGDPAAAEKRLRKLVGFHVLPISLKTKELATAYLHSAGITGGIIMNADPIIEELHAVRKKIYAECGGTMEGLFKHLKQMESENIVDGVFRPKNSLLVAEEQTEYKVSKNGK